MKIKTIKILFPLLSVLLSLSLYTTGHAQVIGISPAVKAQYFDNNGNPLASGSLYTYAAGTTTPLATYQANGASNTNPVVLDSAGRAEIFLSDASYKFILKDSLGNTIWTLDNIKNDGLQLAAANFFATDNILPKFNSTTTLAQSQIKDDGTKVNIGDANTITDELVLAKSSTSSFGIANASSDGQGSALHFYKARGNQAAPSDVQDGDNIGEIGFYGRTNTVYQRGAAIVSSVDGTFSTGQTPPAKLSFITGASSAVQLSISAAGLFQFSGIGLVVGAATGGGKGAGTINIAGDIYQNDTAYTNPDYVFEKYYTGKIQKFASHPGADTYHGIMSLKDVERYAGTHYQLPNVGSTTGMFERSNMILQTTEELYLHLFELQHKIDSLEARVKKLESEAK